MSKTWKQCSEEQGVELNDQYFLIYCGSNEKTREFMEQLHSQYEFKRIPVSAGSLSGDHGSMPTSTPDLCLQELSALIHCLVL